MRLNKVNSYQILNLNWFFIKLMVAYFNLLDITQIKTNFVGVGFLIARTNASLWGEDLANAGLGLPTAIRKYFALLCHLPLLFRNSF